MDGLILDYARAKKTKKRGGEFTKVSLDDLENISFIDSEADVLLIFHEAMKNLKKHFRDSYEKVHRVWKGTVEKVEAGNRAAGKKK